MCFHDEEQTNLSLIISSLLSKSIFLSFRKIFLDTDICEFELDKHHAGTDEQCQEIL